jgi:hydrogenase maturation protein HypF
VRVFPAYFAREPEVVAVDLHPDMHATRVGRELASRLGVPVVEVQHHHAHAAACMAEHGVSEALALVFDGTGLGTDGAIWGGELLRVTPAGFTREGTFAGAPLPGGDAAVKRPARQVIARLLAQGARIDDRLLDRLGVSGPELAAIGYQCSSGDLAPTTHAVGRAFDAFAALVGVAPAAVTYEGQAAVWLEASARAFLGRGGVAPELPFDVRAEPGMAVADLASLFAEVAASDLPGDCAGELAAGFHRAVAGAAVELVRRAGAGSGLKTVALSGGVMLNRILVDQVVAGLLREGYITLLHRAVPPGDGGIALGQAVVAGGDAGCA